MNIQLITNQNSQKNSEIQSFGIIQKQQNKNNFLDEKNIIKKHIKLTKNKGIFSLNEHNNKNVIIDSDSEKSFNENNNNNNKKKTAKLLIEKLELSIADSLNKKLLNKKNQKNFEFIKKNFFDNNFYVFNNNNNKYKIILPQNLLKKYNFHIKKKSKTPEIKHNNKFNINFNDFNNDFNNENKNFNNFNNDFNNNFNNDFNNFEYNPYDNLNYNKNNNNLFESYEIYKKKN